MRYTRLNVRPSIPPSLHVSFSACWAQAQFKYGRLIPHISANPAYYYSLNDSANRIFIKPQ